MTPTDINVKGEPRQEVKSRSGCWLWRAGKRVSAGIRRAPNRKVGGSLLVTLRIKLSAAPLGRAHHR